VNRKDPDGKHIFAGGFLGLDNIGLFDRSRPLPFGGSLEQADATAWMAFYCGTMLAMALELAHEDPAYEDVASKFFEHFVAISDAMNRLGGTGLWNEEDGFYYDQILFEGKSQPVRARSAVGIIPLFASMVLQQDRIDMHPGFKRRMEWFLEHRKDLAHVISYMEHGPTAGHRLLAIPTRDRLIRVLSRVLDENEFLSPFGIRSLSRVHKDAPLELHVDGATYRIGYEPGESTSGMFGGNSNWRGPIWFPLNYLLVEALKRYHYFYGDTLKVECPTGSGKFMNLREAADEINARLARLFVPSADGRRACHSSDMRFTHDPYWRDLVLFHEYFHGDDGRGLGASHQTGWTSLVARCIEELASSRGASSSRGAAGRSSARSSTSVRARTSDVATTKQAARERSNGKTNASTRTASSERTTSGSRTPAPSRGNSSSRAGASSRTPSAPRNGRASGPSTKSAASAKSVLSRGVDAQRAKVVVLSGGKRRKLALARPMKASKATKLAAAKKSKSKSNRKPKAATR
jgi:hypothetical protein